MPSLSASLDSPSANAPEAAGTKVLPSELTRISTSPDFWVLLNCAQTTARVRPYGFLRSITKLSKRVFGCQEPNP